MDCFRSHDFSTSSTAARQQGLAKPLLLAIIGVAIVLLLVAGGAASWFFLHQSSSHKTAKAKPVAPPTFVTVAPMTVNLADNDHVLYIGLSISVNDESTAKQLDSNMPAVRNRLLLALSDQKADALVTAANKRELAQTLRKVLSAPYGPDSQPLKIQQVLFTDFIVQ